MKRIFYMILRRFYMAPSYFFRLWWYSVHLDKYDDEFCFQFIKKFAILANSGGKVTIDAHGMENIPQKDGMVFFPNHQGMFDVLAILESCPKSFRPVLKKELKNIIIVKQVRLIMRGFLMNREDVRDSVKVIAEMTKVVKEGKNCLIFPEGTRSRNGNNLVEFKGGSFKCAMSAKAPIVPVALIDSFKAFDTGSIKPLTVQVHYLPAIPYEEYKGMKTNEVALMVHDRIQEKINSELRKVEEESK